MWHGGFEWYARQNFFHGLIDALRQATRRDFGVDPFVIVEESWLRLDPAAGVDGVFDWFEPGRSFATLMTRNGIRVGHVVPGYDCSRCAPAGPVILRQAGKLYQAALEAVAPELRSRADRRHHQRGRECAPAGHGRVGPVVSGYHQMVRREHPLNGGFLLASSLLPAVTAWQMRAAAHIGSPDIFIEAHAGPYRLLVTVRPPYAIPGVADVEVLTTSDDVRDVRIVPLPLTGPGARFAPVADRAERSAEDPRLFTAISG